MATIYRLLIPYICCWYTATHYNTCSNSLNCNLEILECESELEIINWFLRNYLLEIPWKPNYSLYLWYILNLPVIIDGCIICNLWVIFDSTLSVDAHISSISKSTNFHLCSIGHITKYFSKCIYKLLINDLVLSRIYYCRSLFSDLKNIEVKKIDRIIGVSIWLIYNINRREDLKTDEQQHHLTLLLLRKRCKHILLCLAHKSIFL